MLCLLFFMNILCIYSDTCTLYSDIKIYCLYRPEAVKLVNIFMKLINTFINLYISDICRVCRCEGTSDKPLYHPCVCTGSIKFIHQDWLVFLNLILLCYMWVHNCIRKMCVQLVEHWTVNWATKGRFLDSASHFHCDC